MTIFLLQKRDANGEENTPTTPSVCHARTPCAWAVYVPFTRKIEYFMTNTYVIKLLLLSLLFIYLFIFF